MSNILLLEFLVSSHTFIYTFFTMWLTFAVISGIFFTIQGLLTRHFLKEQKDAWAFSFYFSLIGALVSLPFFLASPSVPTTWFAWLVILLIGIVIVLHNLLFFKAFHYLETSLSGAILKIRLVWVFILGVLIFQEAITWEKIFGIIFTIAAGFIILRRFKRPNSYRGILYVVIAAFLNAVIVILLKYLIGDFNAGSITFLAAFLVPALINLVIMPRSIQRVTTMIKHDGKVVMLACGTGALANLAQNQALATGEATRVVVLLEAFLILTLVGEHIVLKEREQTWIKIVAVLFATIGAVLMSLGR